MIEKIKVKFDVLEALLYYWQVTSEKGKVGEDYIISIGDFPDMKYLYDDEFDKDSVRRVLSAISNREMLNGGSKKERRFWNNNMWMLEDLGFTNMMISPIKTLNLDSLISKLNEKVDNAKYEELEVIFVPGHLDEYYIVDNKLIINFFRVTPDLYEEGKVTIGDKLLMDYIEEKLTEMIK